MTFEFETYTKVDILAKVLYFSELHKKSDFGKWSGAKEHVFLQRISVRVLLAQSFGQDCPLFEKKSRGAWNQQKTIKYTKYMLQNPGVCFFWGRRSAAGSHHTDAQGWWNYLRVGFLTGPMALVEVGDLIIKIWSNGSGWSWRFNYFSRNAGWRWRLN